MQTAPKRAAGTRMAHLEWEVEQPGTAESVPWAGHGVVDAREVLGPAVVQIAIPNPNGANVVKLANKYVYNHLFV